MNFWNPFFYSPPSFRSCWWGMHHFSHIPVIVAWWNKHSCFFQSLIPYCVMFLKCLMRQPLHVRCSLCPLAEYPLIHCFPYLIKNIIRKVLKLYTSSLSVSHSYGFLIICGFYSRSEPSFYVIWLYKQLVPGEIDCCASYSLWKYSPCCTSSRFPKWNYCNLKNTHICFNQKDGNSHTPSSISAHNKAQLTFRADLSLLHLLSFSLRFFWGLFSLLTLYPIFYYYFPWFLPSLTDFFSSSSLIRFCHCNLFSIFDCSPQGT